MKSLDEVVPNMKMTADIPAEITTPNSVKTRIGTLDFFDGFPDERTTELVYDNLDFMRGVQKKGSLTNPLLVVEKAGFA